MKTRPLLGLALAAMITLSACAGESATAPQSGPQTPVDTSVAPPQTVAPSPDATTTPPSGAVTAANLPAAEDLEWNEGATWQAGATTTGGGTEQLSVCQQNSIESLGGNAVQVREFTFGGDTEAVAIAMSFDSQEVADQAYATAQGWVDDCQQVLAAQGRTNGRQVVESTPVTVPNGRAQVTEWTYQTAATGDTSGEFESQGLVQIQDRIALVIMRIEGQDNSWDLEPGGPVGAVHPMIRTLPAVADKLAG